jgi:hypothetical protein
LKLETGGRADQVADGAAAGDDVMAIIAAPSGLDICAKISLHFLFSAY